MSHDRSFTDSTLLGRLAINPSDDRAWADFSHRYGRHILRWCRRIGCPESDCEDVSQEVMVKLMKAFVEFRYDPEMKFRCYLMTVTRSAANDLFRSAAFRNRASGDSAARELLKSEPDRDDLAHAIEQEFRRECLEMAARQVRSEVLENQWLAYELTQRQRLPTGEVAERLGMTRSNVYTSSSRVKKRLAEVMDRVRKQFDGESP